MIFKAVFYRLNFLRAVFCKIHVLTAKSEPCSIKTEQIIQYIKVMKISLANLIEITYNVSTMLRGEF